MLALRTLLIVVVAAVAVSAHVLHQEREVPGNWQLVASPQVDLSQPISLVIALRRANAPEMNRLFFAVSDPRNAKYGEHLKHEQTRSLISPGPDALRAAKRWLLAHGVARSALKISRHEDYIHVRTTLRVAQALLHVTFANYQEAASKRVVARAVGAVVIPDELAATVEVVSGHSEFPVDPRSLHVVHTKTHTDDSFSAASQAFVTPQLLYDAYNMSPSTWPKAPANVTNIMSYAQFGEYTDLTDLTTYCENNFQTNCTVTKFLGEPNWWNTGDDSTESNLDSQCLVTSGGLSNELWSWSDAGGITFGSFCAGLMYWASQVYANSNGTFPFVISISYGSQNPTQCLPAEMTRLSQDVQVMGLMGISVIIASGDHGSAPQTWNFKNGSKSDEFPMTSASTSTFIPPPTGSSSPDTSTSTETFPTFSSTSYSFPGSSFTFSTISSGDSSSGETMTFPPFTPTSTSSQGSQAAILSPSFPATIPWATAVGATYFSGQGSTEWAVGGDLGWGSGGGFSWDFTIPDYQRAAIEHYLTTDQSLPENSANTGLWDRNGRGNPDVSALGAWFPEIIGGFINQVGGTSMSTPLFAGVVAQLNTVRLHKGKTLGFLNPLFYQNPQVFTDITNGNSGWPAAPGWDAATGLGTPNFGLMMELVKSLP